MNGEVVGEVEIFRVDYIFLEHVYASDEGVGDCYTRTRGQGMDLASPPLGAFLSHTHWDIIPPSCVHSPLHSLPLGARPNQRVAFVCLSVCLLLVRHLWVRSEC